MNSQKKPRFSAQRITANEFAEAFTYANEFDLKSLTEAYLAYCFAFPGKRNFLIESRLELEKNLLKQVLAEKDTFRVFHPYPLHPAEFIKNVIVERKY